MIELKSRGGGRNKLKTGEPEEAFVSSYYTYQLYIISGIYTRYIYQVYIYRYACVYTCVYPPRENGEHPKTPCKLKKKKKRRSSSAGQATGQVRTTDQPKSEFIVGSVYNCRSMCVRGTT